LATAEQLSAVFDLDLWRADQPGTVERFDAARFCAWLEALAEFSVALAARQLAEMDTALAVTGLAPQIAVFDPAVFVPSTESDDREAVSGVAERGLTSEIGGYTVVSRRTDSWNTIVAVLTALAEEHYDSFHRVMRGCRRLSNSKPEVDGLHDLLGEAEQVLLDLSLDRENRLERKGFITPAQARAFLESSRRLRLDQPSRPAADPIFTAYLRAVGWSDESPVHAESGSTHESAEPGSADAAPAVAAVVAVLRDAGVLPERPLALLSGSQGGPSRHARLQEHLEFVHERNDAASSLRSQELAFLANVLLAGCPIQARPLTTREAFDAAAATCNLGLENWPRQWLPRPGGATAALPEDFLVAHDLATVFQVGWTVLHENVAMFAAGRLLDTLGTLRCIDRETQLGLHVLRAQLTRHWRAGAPWLARDAFDAVAILDLPSWAALLGLIDQLPVMLANVGTGASRPRSISMSAFEFISDNAQIVSVREFMESLPESLRR
jgi:hypothetical protein